MKIHLVLSGLVTAAAATYLFVSQAATVALVTALGLSGVWVAIARRLSNPSPANRVGLIAVIVIVGVLLSAGQPQLRGLPMQRFYMIYLGSILAVTLVASAAIAIWKKIGERRE